MAIVDHIDWTELDQVVKIQQRNRETYTPVISLFRWWARRPHAVAGAILDAAQLEFGENSFIVSDPFSGGGTVAFESVRRGLPIYAQDLYPWPSLGLATSLTRVDITQLKEAKAQLFQRLQPLRQQFWRKEEDKTWEITHVLRVRAVHCLNCGQDIYLFRDPLISLASRRENEKFAFFGCEACGTVSRRRFEIKSFNCDNCGRHWLVQEKKRYSRTQVICPHCKKENTLNELLCNELRWIPVLLQEYPVSTYSRSVVLRQINKDDPVKDIEQLPKQMQLEMNISPGIETEHLLQYGFRYWGDLYTRRQLRTIFSALTELNTLDTSQAVKDRLQLSVLGASEMAANLCRWERYHPKALEAIANHRYARSTVVVETNLLSPIGRGTIPRRLQAAEKALYWINQEQLPEQTSHAENLMTRRTFHSGALVVTGSSERQLLEDGVIKLVLTDPPYHDDVQYGELSRLFHAWLHIISGIPLPSEASEAVPNRSRGTNSNYYEEIVTICLAESRRTLANNGRLVLTYHNKDIAAWVALANALQRSGFVVIGLATVCAENSADHSKRDTTAFLSDLIIECIQKPEKRLYDLQVAIKGMYDTQERRNLLAIGRAIAEKINTNSHRDLMSLYFSYLKEMHETCTLIH
jgi:putative DNA methylase